MSENPQVYPFKRQLKNQKNLHKENGGSVPLAQQVENALPSKKEKFSWDKLLFLRLNIIEGSLLLFGFCLGNAEILGGLYPFGIAMVAAACVKYRRLAPGLLLTVLLGYGFALKNACLPYILATLAVGGILYFSERENRDAKKAWIVVPGVTLAMMAMVRSISLLLSGVTGYNLMIVFFEAFFAAGLAVVLMIVLDLAEDYESVKRLSTDEMVCVFVLLLGCISGLGDFTIAGVALRDVACRFLVMLAALWGGAGAGAGVGALMGIVPSLSMMASPSTIGLYAFAGLLAGAFNGFGRMGVAAGFVLGNVMLSLYIIDPAQISAHLLGSVVSVALLFLVPSKIIKGGEKLFTKIALRTSGEERSHRLLRLSGRRLKTTAWIFRDLSDNCKSTVSENQEEDDHKNSVQMVLDHLCSRVCAKCSIHDLCWSIDLEETYRGVMGLFGITEKNGMAEVKDAPENFQKRCPHIRELVATINCLYELYCQNNYWQTQKAGSRLFLAGQLEGTAQVLENLAKEINGGDKDEMHIEKAIAKILLKRGLAIDGVQLTHLGDKNLDLWINFQECPGEEVCRELLEKETSKILQRRFKVQEVGCANSCGEGCRFHLLQEGAKTVRMGKAQLAKAGKGVCGDCGSSVTLGEGKQLLMISDGMGVGVKAALQSGTAINMLSKLLEVGFDRDTAIDTVNTVLMLQGGEESFVTLDMCIIDLYENSAEFIKTGAAPSFIKRDSNVQVIKSNSLPVGMLQTVEKAVVKERLLSGDMVILASDGLLDADSKIDMDWLMGLLNDTNITDPQAMAEFLLGKAIAISGGRLRDDITILVAAIDAA